MGSQKQAPCDVSILPGTTARRRIYLMRHGHVDYFAPDVVRTAESTPDGLDLAEPGATLDLTQLALQNQDDEYDEDGEEYEDD